MKQWIFQLEIYKINQYMMFYEIQNEIYKSLFIKKQSIL